ncbi:MAG TPA: vitamin K epoxide reductase family protein [Rhabdochlamydiaceae bacterium]|jgi:uncharacterized membrane protein
MQEKRTKTSLLAVALGMWLIAFALSFFHHSCAFCFPLVVSDCISGILLIAFGFFSCKRNWAGWLVSLVGIWLQCAPLFFWSHSLAVYLNDTLVGAIAIVMGFVINGIKKGGLVEYPKGWSYNPSAWSHRIPTVGLALLCWFFSRYMAGYQLGYISQIWDPFFSSGTMSVITSDVSRAFPVSDAGLGALCYTIEALLGWQGDRRRWASMPWLVFSFAFLVIPVGLVSITLIILQPLIVGAWCSWCLATAFCMLLMIILTAGEFIAMLQFVNQARKRRESAWNVFWHGGVEVGPGMDVRPRSQRRTRLAWGFTVPLNLLFSAVIGLAFMIIPGPGSIQGILASSDYIVGPIIVAISLISMAEVFRFFRYCLIPLGAWVVISPWVFFYIFGWIALVHLVLGILLAFLSLRKGRIVEKYGAWDSYIV